MSLLKSFKIKDFHLGSGIVGLFLLVACATSPGSGTGSLDSAPGGGGGNAAAPRMPDIASAPAIDPKLPGYGVELDQSLVCVNGDQEKFHLEGNLLIHQFGWRDCTPGACFTGRVRILAGEDPHTATTLGEIGTGKNPTTGRDGYFQTDVRIARSLPLAFCLPAANSPDAACYLLHIIPASHGVNPTDPQGPQYLLPLCGAENPTDAQTAD